MSSSTIQYEHPSKLFYNFNLDAYVCKEKPEGHVYLRVAGFTVNTKLIEVPPVTPSQAELAAADDVSGHTVGLWVGMWPTNAAKYRTKKKKKSEGDVDGEGEGEGEGQGELNKTAKQRRRSVQKIIDNKDDVNVLEHDKKALRVVVDPDSQKMQFYVLMNPDSQGICRTHKIDKEEVFFAPQYHLNNLEITEKRRTEWPKRIRECIDELFQKSISKHFRKTNNAQRIITVQPEISKAYEVQRTLEAFEITNELSSLEAAIMDIEALDKDLKDRPASASNALNDMMLLKPTFDAQKVLAEIKIIWPECKNAEYLSVETIRTLRIALRENKQFLEWRLLKATLLDLSRRYKPAMKSGVAARSEALVSTLAFVRLIDPHPIHDKPTTNDPSRSMFARFVETHLHMVKALHESIKTSSRRINSMVDVKILTGDGLADIWKAVGNSPDLDSVLTWAIQAYTLMVQDFALTYGQEAEEFGKYVVMLERFAQEVREEDDGEGDDERLDDEEEPEESESDTGAEDEDDDEVPKTKKKKRTVSPAVRADGNKHVQWCHFHAEWLVDCVDATAVQEHFEQHLEEALTQVSQIGYEGVVLGPRMIKAQFCPFHIHDEQLTAFHRLTSHSQVHRQNWHKNVMGHVMRLTKDDTTTICPCYPSMCSYADEMDHDQLVDHLQQVHNILSSLRPQLHRKRKSDQQGVLKDQTLETIADTSNAQDITTSGSNDDESRTLATTATSKTKQPPPSKKAKTSGSKKSKKSTPLAERSSNIVRRKTKDMRYVVDTSSDSENGENMAS